MSPRSPDRVRRCLLRVVAGLLMAVIGADLADTACDPVGAGAHATTGVRAAGPSGADEPCADVCVADCFCCSRSVPAGAVAIVPEPRQLTVVAASAAERTTDGVPPVVDRPPLA